jgi:hypothetical protein
MEKETFKGFVYIKLHEMGTRSEGPDYYLQIFNVEKTVNVEHRLKYADINLWEVDYYLEFFCRKKVEVTGELDKKTDTIIVTEIREISDFR